MIDDQKPSDGNAPNTEPEGSSDVHLIEVGNRKIYLVGTAHVSQQSVDLVREVIDRERPDAVCIELDNGRFESLSQEKKFEEQDLRQVLKNKQLATLMLNLILASYQRRLGLQLGVTPGSDGGARGVPQGRHVIGDAHAVLEGGAQVRAGAGFKARHSLRFPRRGGFV